MRTVRRLGWAASSAALLVGSVLVGAAPAGAGAASYSTAGTHTFVVPEGVDSVTVVVCGAQGAANSQGVAGGRGGRVTATIPVTPLEELGVIVGGAGLQSAGLDSGGFNGGGRAGYSSAGGVGGTSAGGGGGATEVRRGTGVLLVAGGGGGSGGGGGGGSVPIVAGGAGGAGGVADGDGQNGSGAAGGIGGGGGAPGGPPGGGVGTGQEGGIVLVSGIFDFRKAGGGGGGGVLGGGGGGITGSTGFGGGGGGGGGWSVIFDPASTGRSADDGHADCTGDGFVSITWDDPTGLAQPDVLIKNGPTFVGDGDYGPGQAAHRDAARAQQITYRFRVQNDGTTSDQFLLSGTGTTERSVNSFTVDGVDVTAAIVAGTYATDLAPGDFVTVKAQVTPQAAAALRSKVRTRLLATSASDPTLKDRARGITSIVA